MPPKKGFLQSVNDFGKRLTGKNTEELIHAYTEQVTTVVSGHEARLDELAEKVTGLQEEVNGLKRQIQDLRQSRKDGRTPAGATPGGRATGWVALILSLAALATAVWCLVHVTGR